MGTDLESRVDGPTLWFFFFLTKPVSQLSVCTQEHCHAKGKVIRHSHLWLYWLNLFDQLLHYIYVTLSIDCGTLLHKFFVYSSVIIKKMINIVLTPWHMIFEIKFFSVSVNLVLPIQTVAISFRAIYKTPAFITCYHLFYRNLSHFGTFRAGQGTMKYAGHASPLWDYIKCNEHILIAFVNLMS